MDLYRFVLGIVLGLYIGFPRLNQLRFIARDPILTGILKVTKLPVQSTFWRFVTRCIGSRPADSGGAAAHAGTGLGGGQRGTGGRHHRHRHHGAHAVRQQMGGRKSYNPKNKGKKSYQPMLTFIAETREYVWGELRNGDRPTGKQIARSSAEVFAALPPGVKQIYGRADSGFYCREAVEAYEEPAGPVRDLCAQDVPVGRGTDAKPSGSRRPRRMPTRNANSVTSRTDGASPIGSWPCATEEAARKWKPRKPSSTSCSTPASTSTGSS